MNIRLAVLFINAQLPLTSYICPFLCFAGSVFICRPIRILMRDIDLNWPTELDI